MSYKDQLFKEITFFTFFSLILLYSTAEEQEVVSREGSRDQHEHKDNTNITSRRESKGEIASSRGQGQRDILTVVASDTVTANTELHYILTSMFDVSLVERNAR